MNTFKPIARVLCLLTALTLCSSGVALADDWVNGYYRSNGTYVTGHWRSSANDTPCDNWSTAGNQNPYTGTWGTRQYSECTDGSCLRNKTYSRTTLTERGYR